MPSPGRRTSPLPRISSRHSPPSVRRRSPDHRQPSTHMPRGSGSGHQPTSRLREGRRSLVHEQPQRHPGPRGRSRSPVHEQPQRHADSRGRSRRNQGSPPRGRPSPTSSQPPPRGQRRRSPHHPDMQRLRNPLPSTSAKREIPTSVKKGRSPSPSISFLAPGSNTKRKLQSKEQGRLPVRGHENGSNRGGRRTDSPLRKVARSRSPHSRSQADMSLIGPAEVPVSRDYLSYRPVYSPPAGPPVSTSTRFDSPHRNMALTDRFKNDPVFKGPEVGMNIKELKNTKIHVIRKIPAHQQNQEYHDIDTSDLYVPRRSAREFTREVGHISEVRGHYHQLYGSEGSKPIFERQEIKQAMVPHPDKYDLKYETDDHTRVVIFEDMSSPPEGQRFPPHGRFEPERFDGPSTSRDTRYNSNDYRPAIDYDRPSTSYNQHDNSRSERQGDDLRSRLDYRRSPVMHVEGGSLHERSEDHRGGPNSDLRARLVEKRTDRRDDRSYVERPPERERYPPSMDRRHPSEFSNVVRQTDSRPERGQPDVRRIHSSPEVHHRDFDRRSAADFESRRSHGEPEMRRSHGEPELRRSQAERTSRRPPADFEGRVSRTEPGSRRRQAPSDGRHLHEVEEKRRRSRDEPSPLRYRDNQEFSEPPNEWESEAESDVRRGMYFETEVRNEEPTHISERGRGRGISRVRRGSGSYRGRGLRGGLPGRGAGNVRGMRPQFRPPMHLPRAYPLYRGLRRGYPPRKSPNRR